MSTKVEICGGVDIAEIDGRPVLQPACNRVARADEGHNGKPAIRKSLKPSPAPKALPLKPHCLQNLPSKHVSAPQPKSPPPSPSAKAGLLTIPSKHSIPRSQAKPLALNKPPLQNALEIASSPPSPSSSPDAISKESSPALTAKLSPPISPQSRTKSVKPTSVIIKPSSQRALLKRANDTASLNISTDKPSSNEAVTPKASLKASVAVKISTNGRKKSRKLGASESSVSPTKAPGSLAAARKAEISELHAQRKLKIAHYGRKQGTPKAEKVVPEEITPAAPQPEEIRRCSFITPQSDPVYTAYHDREWGVPVHDDKMLFELLVLMGAQVGMNWPTILSKRQVFRYYHLFPPWIDCFKNHDLQIWIVQEFGSFDKYIWGFVNFKPIVNKYRHARNIPVKTSKAETISKDLVKRNFRFVGPTIMYSFMQAAGITNDHLVNCYRHEECLRMSQQGSNT